MGIVKIRLSGDRADIEAVVGFLSDTQAVKKFPLLLARSIFYHNHDDPGVHQYLAFFIEGEENPCLVPVGKPNKPEQAPAC